MESENLSNTSSSEHQTPPPPPQPPFNDEWSPENAVITEKRQRDWSTYVHLSGLCCFIGLPSFLGPLILWLIKKDEMPFVDAAGKEAVNFHLTMLIVSLISIPLAFLFVGFVTIFAAQIMAIVFSIIAALEANKGMNYRYPLTFRLIR